MNEDKWMNAIVEIIMCTNRGISNTEPEENAIRDFLSEIQNGNSMQAFLKMPSIIWMTCESYDLQEEFSNLFIKAIKDDKNFEEVINLTAALVHRAIFDGVDLDGQANGEFFLECLKQIALQSLQERRVK